MKYVAYIIINGRISVELWSMDFSKSIEVRLGKLLKKIEINDEDKNLPFDQLVRKYPYEEVSNSGAVDGNTSDGTRP